MAEESTVSSEHRALLAADLWPGFNFADPGPAYKQFFGNARVAFKRLIEGILLHDHITVPTESFMSLTALIDVLGETALIDLLDAGILRFVRINKALAYMGNGSGLQVFSMNDEEDRNRSIPCFGPVDEAVKWALSGLEKPISNPAIRRIVEKATHEIDADSVFEEIRHETYMDILESPYLRTEFSVRNSELDKLTGIAPNAVRTYDGFDPRLPSDEIETVLALGRTNIELFLANEARCADCSTIMPIGHILKAKNQRTRPELDPVEAFAQLRTITDIPDFADGVLEQKITIRDLINLRESRHFKDFQPWFHENCKSDPIRTGREYARLLKDLPKSESLPARVIRFVCTSAVGMIADPVTSTGVSVFDSFVFGKFLQGHSPKFFIEELRQLCTAKNLATSQE